MNLTELQKQSINSYYTKGLNSTEIAKKLNLDKKLVDLYIIDEYFIENSKHKFQTKLTKEIAKQLVENFYNGVSFNKSCKKFGFSQALWTNKKKELNLDFQKANTFDYSVWTKDHIKELINDFNSGIPVYKLVEKYGFHKNALAKIINENGGNTTPVSFDNTVFNKINSEEKAYWLGFLYADGAVSSKDNGLELSLQLLDAEHLNKFKMFLKSSSSVRLDFKIGRCRINVSNKQFKEDLIKCGCTPRKSLTLKFPSKNILPERLYTAFIRGYFDGDGYLSHTYSDTKKQRFTICASFVGTKEFCKNLEEILSKENIHFSWHHDKRHDDNVWSIKCNKTCSVKLLNYIYKDAKIYLERKYSKYKFFKEHNNFAVYVSDYVDHNRTISVKAKQWIKDNLNIDVDSEYANTEITKKSNDFLES